MAIQADRIRSPGTPRSTSQFDMSAPLRFGEVLVVALQPPSDAVLRVGGAHAASAQLGGGAAAYMGGGLVGQLHDVEVVDHQPI